MKHGTVYGVQSLDDMRERCVVDQETGCWSWSMYSVPARGGYLPIVWVPAGVIGTAGAKATATRAAWLLSGRKIRPGNIVWRCCGNKLCINPEHLRSTSKSAHGKWISEQGHTRGVHRKTASRRASMSRMASPELVSAIEADIAAGLRRVDIIAKRGTSNYVYYRVLNRLHPHQRHGLIPGASVFSLAGGSR